MARRDYFEVLDAKVMIVAASRFDQKWVWQKKKPLWAHERALIIIASMVLSIISVTCVGERESPHDSGTARCFSDYSSCIIID